jgi:hypothetical protein
MCWPGAASPETPTTPTCHTHVNFLRSALAPSPSLLLAVIGQGLLTGVVWCLGCRGGSAVLPPPPAGPATTHTYRDMRLIQSPDCAPFTFIGCSYYLQSPVLGEEGFVSPPPQSVPSPASRHVPLPLHHTHTTHRHHTQTLAPQPRPSRVGVETGRLCSASPD